MRKTDRDWTILGEKDPYWGVISHDQYRQGKLSKEGIKQFYESGVRHVELIMRTIRSRLDARFAPRTALDFGCGVGRVTIPLARHCESVLGLDVSPGMVKRAQERCACENITNAAFAVCGDELDRISGSYELIHTFIVLQHIPSRRGMRVVHRLLESLSDGGVCVLHATYAHREAACPDADAPLARRARQSLRRLAWRNAGPLMRCVRPRVDRSGPAPITSYEYDLNELFRVVQEAGIRHIDIEYTEHAGLYGVILFFQRSPGATYFA